MESAALALSSPAALLQKNIAMVASGDAKG